MSEHKKITLHPLREDGSIDTDTNLYPKTSINQIVSDEGEAVEVATQGDIEQLRSEKQDTLVSGQNICKINNKSILGKGNIEITGTQLYASRVELYAYTDSPSNVSIQFNILSTIMFDRDIEYDWNSFDFLDYFVKQASSSQVYPHFSPWSIISIRDTEGHTFTLSGDSSELWLTAHDELRGGYLSYRFDSGDNRMIKFIFLNEKL